jgi:hypothetical protein
MPRADGGASLAIGWRHEHWLAEARGTWLASETVDLPHDVGADLGLLAAGGRACLVQPAGPSDVGLCGGVRLDVLQGKAVGVVAAASSAITWITAEVGAHGALWVARRLAVRVDLEVGAPSTRPAFVIVGAGHVHRPAGIVGSASIGLEAGIF